MGGFEIAMILGLVILLVAVMYLASQIQKLHRRARHLRHLVQKLEGLEKENDAVIDNEMGA
jgi:uncharacterized coiled-coil protein SlyX